MANLKITGVKSAATMFGDRKNHASNGNKIVANPYKSPKGSGGKHSYQGIPPSYHYTTPNLPGKGETMRFEVEVPVIDATKSGLPHGAK